jgi:CHAT domain-containing protein
LPHPYTLVPATANGTTISGDAATRAGALEALEQNTWVHLACHGKQDPMQPYNSHFVMRSTSDYTKAAWALNRATRIVKTKVPLEQRIVFIHIGV